MRRLEDIPPVLRRVSGTGAPTETQPTMSTYFAIDPAGVKHTRSSLSRVYSHTVVLRQSYEHDIAAAEAKDNAQQDRHNWDYYVAILTGRDPFPERPMTTPTMTPAKRDAEIGRAARRNADKLANAKKEIGNPYLGLDAYLSRKHTERIALVERRRAEGYYDRWHNAGWCGRRELAEKLLASQRACAWVAEAVIVDVQKA